MAHRSDGENHDDDCCFYLKAFYQAFPGGSDSKETACNVEDLGSIPVSGRSPGKGNGYPFQNSCLENSINRGAWRVIVYGFT